MKTMETPQTLFPNWMRGFLLIATVYNAFWGIFIAWFPEAFYHWVTESQNDVPSMIVWQGRAVLIMAFGYLFSAMHPGKLWYFPIIGALTKIIGGIWFYLIILEGIAGKQGIFHLIMNDAVWIPFFVAISFRARKYKLFKASEEER